MQTCAGQYTLVDELASTVHELYRQDLAHARSQLEQAMTIEPSIVAISAAQDAYALMAQHASGQARSFPSASPLAAPSLARTPAALIESAVLERAPPLLMRSTSVLDKGWDQCPYPPSRLGTQVQVDSQDSKPSDSPAHSNDALILAVLPAPLRRVVTALDEG